MNPEELWFNTPDVASLCRGGGNGPAHPTQLYAIEKYCTLGQTFLDYGCGSATTYEALTMKHPKSGNHLILYGLQYTGVDIIPKNIEWCRQQYPEATWIINAGIHKISTHDDSFDVVYSRHVVDHMKSFEDAMDEHCRVAKKLVIVVLWTGLVDGDEHEIKNIVDGRGTPDEKTYPDEYTNNYSRKLVKEYLENKEGWKLLELTENVGSEVKGCDTVICLQRSS